ncbi:putative glucosidase 2 subunit beta protein [Phaeoacremonium minimum UCRPA7]|uniref:Glucosidase 2 subunit beta n=1 Tax=Phaeoacremonium minimum (strain UCR-PA7) TaxID=1286976 RepID=R8BEL6_PHAM7|nr:putative glucosidase 2 subunit beta protein [Phaeoacremonium minimum UCRPA7]EON97730.1 putative glucosidase 2 subunit beta protein [Phaeoacremonium minimum UCRPA7]
MRQTSALVLLSTIQGAVVAASLPRGVGPEFAKFYTAKDTFTCIGHPSISLSSSQINDNSCDCPDGSDEPGTAACSYLDPLSPPQPLPASLTGTTNTSNVLPGFWCANEGHIGAYVPFAFVNDGICDYELCCDGSEEFGKVGGVKCENRCGPIGKEWRRVEEERTKSKERAAKRRRTLAKEAKELRRRVEAKITTLTEEIKTLEVKRDDLQKKYEEVERAERGKVVKGEGQGGKLGVLLGLAKTRVKELRDTLDRVLDQRDDLQDKVEELEAILRKFKEEYNPNFNDEGVKAAVKAWEDYAAKTASETQVDAADADILEIIKEDGESSGINWKEFEDEEVSDTDILYNLEAYLPSFLREYIHGKLTLARVWLIENGILADNPAGGAESRLVTAAREAHQAVVNEVTSKQRTLTEQQSDLEKDYGADDIFRALKGKCVSTDSGEYEYELCWLDKTSQKSKKGHGNTNMGNFVRMDTEMADDEERQDGKGLGKGPRLVLHYENGQGCWNGPNRRTDVWLGCAETEELWRVVEAEKCVYKMEVGTPAACEDVHEPGVRTKDEL